MTDFFLFSDSSTSVTINPEWGYADPKAKIQARHRSTTGAEYSYTYATYQTFKVPVSYVTSADRYQIQQWWESNTSLSWMEEGTTAVTVRITNDTFPLSKRNKPYYDLFMGELELSTQ